MNKINLRKKLCLLCVLFILVLFVNCEEKPKRLPRVSLLKFTEGSVATEDLTIILHILIDNIRLIDEKLTGFVEQDRGLSLEAVHFTIAVQKRPIFWKEVKNHSKTSSEMITRPITDEIQTIANISSPLQFDIQNRNISNFFLNTNKFPAIDITNSDGLKFTVSVYDDEPVITHISRDYQVNKTCETPAAESIKIFKIPFRISQDWRHTLQYWMSSLGVVLQKLVLNTDGLSHLY